MPDVIALLEHLADTPPAAPRPPDELRARAMQRRRRRHRRRLAGGGVVTMILLVGVVAVVQRDGRDTGGGRVNAGPSTSASGATATTGPTLDESRGLSVTPSTGLADGDTVTLSLDPDPGGEIVATQCAAEVLELTGAMGTPTEWCGSSFYLRSPAGRPDLTMPVTRSQRAGEGSIDCAVSPGRCVIMVGNGLIGDHVAPLAFDDSEPLYVPTVRLVDGDGPVDDGELVEVEVEGMTPNATATLVQCSRGNGCDEARTSAQLTAGGSGQVATEVRLFHDIWTTPGGWTSCDPCDLLLRTYPETNPVARFEIEPTADPIHPSLRIVEDPPYAPDQTITVAGEGFQVGQQVGLGWCRDGSDTCTFQGDWPTTDDEGRLSSEYSLPSAASALDCIDTVGHCSITWAPSVEGASPVVEIPIDLTG